MRESPYYGRNLWTIRDFDGVAAVPGSLGDVMVGGGALTPEQIAQCSGGPAPSTTDFHVGTNVSAR